MRRKKIVVVVVVLLVAISLSGKSEKNFMWEVENGSSKVYLLGSVHFMKPEVYPLDQEIENAFEKSDILVVELDATKLDPAAIQKLIMEKGTFKDGKTLQSVLSARLYEMLANELEESKMMTIGMVNNFKPWYTMITLASIRMMKLGMDPKLGIDIHFLEKAKDKKEIIELESADFQLQVLSSLEDTVQLKLLEQSIEEPDETPEMIEKILDSWQKGETKNIEELIVEKLKKEPETLPFYNKMFPERNKEMTEKIIEFLNSEDGKTYFVIVGSGHYVGDDGILKLLEDKGFEAKQR